VRKSIDVRSLSLTNEEKDDLLSLIYFHRAGPGRAIVLILNDRGKTCEQIADIVGVERSTVYESRRIGRKRRSETDEDSI